MGGGHHGLLLPSGWFGLSLGAVVLGFIGTHQLAKWYYEIPTHRNFNVTNWPYALKRAELRRQGIDPDGGKGPDASE